jgi:tetratricopeptide (TPR) repeat protein
MKQWRNNGSKALLKVVQAWRYRAALLVLAAATTNIPSDVKSQFVPPPVPGHKVVWESPRPKQKDSSSSSSSSSSYSSSSHSHSSHSSSHSGSNNRGQSHRETTAERKARERYDRGFAFERRGDAARQKGMLDEALQLYQQALKGIPDSEYLEAIIKWCKDRILFDKANAAVMRRDYEQAITFSEELYQRNPDDEELGKSVRSLKADFIDSRAVDAWNKQIEENTYDTDVLKKAIKSWEQARSIFPENSARYDEMIKKSEKVLQEAIATQQREADLTSKAQVNLDRLEATLDNKGPATEVWLPNPADILVEISDRKPASYEEAKRNVVTLQSRQDRLEQELHKVESWQHGLRKDRAEFEKIREQAQRDFVSDVVLHIPVSETFERLLKAKYITSETATRLKEAFHAAQGLLAGAQGVTIESRSKEQDKEQLAKIVEAEKELRAAMTDRAAEKLITKEGKEWLKRMNTFLDVAVQAAKYAHERDGSWEPVGRFVVNAGTALYPPADLLVAGDVVLEKDYQRHLANQAIDALQEALSENFKAEDYLHKKIRETKGELAAANATVMNYESERERGN